MRGELPAPGTRVVFGYWMTDETWRGVVVEHYDLEIGGLDTITDVRIRLDNGQIVAGESGVYWPEVNTAR